MIKKRQLTQLLSIFTILLFAALIVSGLGNSFTPLLFSASIAYLTFPVVRSLEHIGIQRHWAVFCVFIISLLGLFLLVIWLLPILLADMRNFIASLPNNIQLATNQLQEWALFYGIELNMQGARLGKLIEASAKHLSIDTLWTVTSLIKGLFSGLLNTLLTLLNLFLIPVFFFYIIKDFETYQARVKSWIPVAWQKKLFAKARQFNIIFQGYFRGQLIVASIQAIFYATMLSLLNVPFGFFIGLATGILTIIPYVGYSVGVIATILVLLANPTAPYQIIGVIITFSIAQVVESFYLTPKLVGNKVGLSELTTMLVLIIGGQLFGLIGMFIAIPTACLIKLILKDLKQSAKVWG